MDAINAAEAAAAAELEATTEVLREEQRQHEAAAHANRQMARDAAELERVRPQCRSDRC